MISKKVKQALCDALQQEGTIGAVRSVDETPLEIPRIKERGDYASNLPFVLAGELKRPPLEIAEKLAGRLNEAGGIVAEAEAVKPGFLNLRLHPVVFHREALEARSMGDAFGRSDCGKGKKVQVEFVSANPTGPLSVGHGRLAAFGDALARVLEATGHEVEREYYINDAGNQIRKLAVSFDMRYREQLGQNINIEEGGYLGDYLVDYAKDLVAEKGDAFLQMEEEARTRQLGGILIERIKKDHQKTLAAFNIEFQNWFSESDLHRKNRLEEAMSLLKEKGHVFEQDGAVWFRSSAFTDSQDRVLKKADGSPTYFLSDIAYHLDKFNRGFDRTIDIWGADHHGYVERLKSSMSASGVDPSRLEVLIVQLVRFKESGIYQRMSKRSGNFIALSDLIEEIGADVARLFFLTRGKDSHLEFDLELAKQKSEANPLYYLQYAHARICSILRKAEGEGRRIADDEGPLAELTHPAEVELLKGIADFPWEVEIAAQNREPHRVAHNLAQFAGNFHNFYHQCKAIVDDDRLCSARLALCDASRVLLKNGLRLLGLSAPESM